MIPNPTRPDYYWENQYYLDEEKAEREAMEKSSKAAVKNTGMLLSGLFKLVIGALLWTSGLITAYFILKGSNSFNQHSIWQKIGMVVGTAYLVNCLIFFLKGMMIALRADGRKAWLMLWLINTCFICLPPAILVYLVVSNFVNPAKEMTDPNIWNVAAGIMILYIVYSKFGLTSRYSPKAFDWITRIGYRTIKRTTPI